MRASLTSHGRGALLIADNFAVLAQPAGAAVTDTTGDEPTLTEDAIVVSAIAPGGALTVDPDPKQTRQPAPASGGADRFRTIQGSVLRDGGYRSGDAKRPTAGSDILFDRRYTEHLNLAGRRCVRQSGRPDPDQ